jgi:hypothetical protein
MYHAFFLGFQKMKDGIRVAKFESRVPIAPKQIETVLTPPYSEDCNFQAMEVSP